MAEAAPQTPLVYVRDRLERAELHFRAIRRELRAYYRSCTDGVSGEYFPDRHALTIVPGWPVPEVRMNTLVGEFLHELRSSLDHLAYKLVQVNGGTPTDDSVFPILHVAPPANKKGAVPPPKVVGGVSATARAILDAAQPYQWQGDFAKHPLYILDALWDVDKHRHIIAHGSQLEADAIAEGTPRTTFTLRVDYVNEKCAEISFVSDDPSVEMSAHTTMRMMVNEPGKLIPLTPLLDALKDAQAAVLRVVTDAEDKCFEPFTYPL